MPNLDPWINQSSQKEKELTTTNTMDKLENHLLYVRAQNRRKIKPNCHPTYNEDHEKRIEMIDWTLKKYKDSLLKKTHQQENEEQVIIDNIIEELDKKRDEAINKKKKALLKDEMLKYRLEEDTLDYVIFIIRDFTGRYYN